VPRPLSGIRILDFTWVVAGPLATRVLADHGAEIIKVERPDAKQLDRRREALHASLNRGKRSIILDLERQRGIEIARQLVGHCDVVIDNFSSRVMSNWGLSYADLRRIKPDVITLGMSGFGRDGPCRDYVSYGPTLQAMAGFTRHMCRPGGEPAGWGFSYSDMVSGYSAAFAILAALRYRSRTGQGQSIDLAQYEALLTFIGPESLAAATDRSAPPPIARAAPEGIYRCADLEGDGRKRDRWCALAVFTDDEWKRCIQVFGNSKWALESRFATLAGRITHRQELDASIETWTSQRSAEEVVERLQAARIAAGIVADAEDLCVHDPHLAARRYWQRTQTGDGRNVMLLDAVTPRLSHTPGEVAFPAPQPGEQTDQVLRELLHLEQTRIDALRQERTIA
jgi:crotonobetainyl-CoA:carnitine CoA-transferase CaiB-like acyl-CoA transferase